LSFGWKNTVGKSLLKILIKQNVLRSNKKIQLHTLGSFEKCQVSFKTEEDDKKETSLVGNGQVWKKKTKKNR